MELFVAMVNSFYQSSIITKTSALDVETFRPDHTGLDDQAF